MDCLFQAERIGLGLDRLFQARGRGTHLLETVAAGGAADLMREMLQTGQVARGQQVGKPGGIVPQAADVTDDQFLHPRIIVLNPPRGLGKPCPVWQGVAERDVARLIVVRQYLVR